MVVYCVSDSTEGFEFISWLASLRIGEPIDGVLTGEKFVNFGQELQLFSEGSTLICSFDFSSCSVLPFSVGDIGFFVRGVTSLPYKRFEYPIETFKLSIDNFSVIKEKLIRLAGVCCQQDNINDFITSGHPSGGVGCCPWETSSITCQQKISVCSK